MTFQKHGTFWVDVSPIFHMGDFQPAIAMLVLQRKVSFWGSAGEWNKTSALQKTNMEPQHPGRLTAGT